MILTFKYRLLPTSAQHATLAAILEGQRLLYNAALEERIGCYRHTGEGRSYVDQCKGLTEWRYLDPEAAAVPVSFANCDSVGSRAAFGFISIGRCLRTPRSDLWFSGVIIKAGLLASLLSILKLRCEKVVARSESILA